MPKGACYCGTVRYEAAGAPFNETSCHCSICRGTTGAPFVAWFSVRREDFRFVAGTPTRFDSTAQASRSFCGRSDAVPPRDHIWTRSRLSWIRLADGLPEHRESRLSGSS